MWMLRNWALWGALLWSIPATAETFRCSGHIVETGMSQDEVLEHCGPPDTSSNQTRISWTYKEYAGGMDIVVYFYANGDVESIESVRHQ